MGPRILLTSVFKPFAIDDIYSRKESKIELCHNQLTRNQGLFSMRTYQNTYGIHAIANNLDHPATVLDFPTFERFQRELAQGYDIVGIGAIVPNFQKVKRMAEETRRRLPRAQIVVGGFCATVPDLDQILPVDHVCVGEGISFMRDLLGEPAEFTFKNPDVFAENTEIFGIPLFGLQQNPHIVVGLGCSYGCDFCSVTHFFGRRHLKFYATGEALFAEMLRIEKKFRSNIIVFIGDDNFLIDLKRAEELRRRVVESGRMFKVFVFGSADRAREFGPERLAEMGVDTIWIGRESEIAGYRKNEGVDIPALVAELRRFGIKTILSSILLLDGHTKQNIRADIDRHLDCRPTFSQFAHYSPAPGTPLWDRMREEGRLLTAIPFEDCHAFKQPWFVHPEFTAREAEDVQNEAYDRDFLELGPSVMRYIEVECEGYETFMGSDKPHFRARAAAIAQAMWKYRVVLNATITLAPNEHVARLARGILDRVEAGFGRTSAIEKAMAAGFHVFGRTRQFRTRLWGDAIQPRTRVLHYRGRSEKES